jgi:hypothetical protein
MQISRTDGDTVTVYRAWTVHPDTSETTVTRYKGVPAWIAKLPRGKPIMETAEDADAAAIDEPRRYIADAKLKPRGAALTSA